VCLLLLLCSCGIKEVRGYQPRPEQNPGGRKWWRKGSRSIRSGLARLAPKPKFVFSLICTPLFRLSCSHHYPLSLLHLFFSISPCIPLTSSLSISLSQQPYIISWLSFLSSLEAMLLQFHCAGPGCAQLGSPSPLSPPAEYNLVFEVVFESYLRLTCVYVSIKKAEVPFFVYA